MGAVTARGLAVVALVTVGGFGLAGCSSTDPVAAPDSTPAATFANTDDYLAAWNDCLREHGVEVGAKGEISINSDGDSLLEQANKDCTAQMPLVGADGQPFDVAKAHVQGQRTVLCLRERGYDIADLAADEYTVVPQHDMSLDDFNECSNEEQETNK